jgi:glycosyltransferase involved in cell wall biosynthesis
LKFITDMKKASVLIITYNHEKYIAETIESIVSQKVNFDFEVVIGEDLSTDGTRNICEKYAAKYPGLIRLLPSDKNYGAVGNEVRTLKACTGEYIALCEGDDYWIDNSKLQKQIDFLDANPDFSLSFTAIEVIDETGPQKQGAELNFSGAVQNAATAENGKNIIKDTFSIEDLIDLRYNPMTIHTATMLFRNCITFPLPDFYYKTFTTDYALFLLLGTKGRIKYFSEKTAAYRIHAGGITKTEEFKMKSHKSQFEMFDSFNEYTHFKYHKIIKELLFPAAKTILIYESNFLKGKERRKHIFRMIKAYNRYQGKVNIKEIIYYNLILFFPFPLRLYKFFSTAN